MKPWLQDPQGNGAHAESLAQDGSYGVSSDQASSSAAEDDEHYNRYLREREAMMRTPDDEASNANGTAVNGAGHPAPEVDDQTRRAFCVGRFQICVFAWLELPKPISVIEKKSS